MSYLAKLKARIRADKIQDGRATELTKPPKPRSVSFVSSLSGASENFPGVASALARSAALPDLDIERAAIVEYDAKVPRDWAEGYARLQGQTAPVGVSSNRWQMFIDDCGWFLDRWAEKAAALGWRSADLFGLAGIKPVARVDLAGLCWLLQGRELVALTYSAAAIRGASGAILHYHRRDRGPGQLLAWEIQHKEPRP